MTQIYLGIGGNLGVRELFLAHTRKHLATRVGMINGMSSVYETDAWGMGDAPAFLNQVIAVQTNLSPLEVLSECLAIESVMGRKRAAKAADGYTSRTCDIDVLLYGNEVLSVEELQVPHPGMAERKFVLTPLAEIAGDTIHPITGETIETMLQACVDTTEVKKWDSLTAT